MIRIGFFREMHLYNDDGSVKEHLVESVDYDKEMVARYLEQPLFRVAGCPRAGIDCVTGTRISDSFSVYNDGDYEWCDFLPYHVRNYNIELPKEFVEKATRFISLAETFSFQIEKTREGKDKSIDCWDPLVLEYPFVRSGMTPKEYFREKLYYAVHFPEVKASTYMPMWKQTREE